MINDFKLIGFIFVYSQKKEKLFKYLEKAENETVLAVTSVKVIPTDDTLVKEHFNKIGPENRFKKYVVRQSLQLYKNDGTATTGDVITQSKQTITVGLSNF
jgi:hypothetical protein